MWPILKLYINVAGVWSSCLPDLTVDYSNTSSLHPIPSDDLNIHVENVSSQFLWTSCKMLLLSSSSYPVYPANRQIVVRVWVGKIV